MKISRQTAVALIFLAALIFLVSDASAQLEGVAKGFKDVSQGDLFKNLTNFSFWGAGIAVFIVLYGAMRLFKAELVTGDKKAPILVLIGLVSYYAAGSVAEELGRRAAGLAFKAGLALGWKIIIVAAFLFVVLYQEKSWGQKGLEFGIVWLITSALIGPQNSLTTGATFDSAISTHVSFALMWALGIWGAGHWIQKRDEAKKRADEQKQKLEDEKKQVNSIEKVREDLRTEMKAEQVKLGQASTTMTQAQQTVQAQPTMMYPVMANVMPLLPTAYLQQFNPLVPATSAPKVYDEDKRETEDYKKIQQTLINNYGETNPGKEIIYVNQIIKALEYDLKSGEPRNWQSYAAENKAVHAEQIARFGNPGAKQIADDLRRLASAKGMSVKQAIRSTNKLLEKRMGRLLKMKKQFIRTSAQALALREKKLPAHVEAYRKRDEALKRLNNELETFNTEVNKHNKDLYEVSRLIADAKPDMDISKLRETFDSVRNRILELITEIGALNAEKDKLDAVIAEARKSYKAVDKAEFDINKFATAEELFKLMGTGKPPEEGGQPALLVRG